MIIFFIIIFLFISPVSWASGWYSTLQGTASDVEQDQIPNGVTLQYDTSSSEWRFSYANVPTGGTTGQVLTKNSSSNYDYSWTTISGGGSGNIDGGNSLSIYLPSQIIDGGPA